MLKDKEQVRIRLFGIDCPERGQDFGARAKQLTSDLSFGKIVDVTEVDIDRYKRVVAIITFPDGKILNEALVAASMAWVYQRYCNREECSRWLELEEEARKQKIGIWSMPNPMPPWEFRRR